MPGNLKKNIAANYASQIYVTIVGIIFLPFYIKYMGSEVYGLIGFFTMLQAWFTLLDLGLTPTIARETARYKGNVLTALEYSQLYRALNIIFVVIAFVGGTSLFLLSDLISTSWLNLSNLTAYDVKISLEIMAISVALRWISGLYRGVITGSEKLVWLSYFNSIIATFRFVGVFITMWLFGFTALVFFIYQLLIVLFECFLLRFKANSLVPNKNELTDKIGWSFSPIKPILKFSLTIAFTSSIWVFVTQTDKLILSGILSLDNYGYFTLAVLVANGIMIIGSPISSAIMPRMARLHAENKHVEMINVYRESTHLVTFITGIAAITLIISAKSVLIAWTGDLLLAEKAASILRLYAAGNLLLCISAFAYYLQYAKGILKYHLIGNAVLVVILIPSIIFAAKHYGGVGAGYVWLIMNVIYLFFWVAYIHKKLEPELHLNWLWNDFFKILLPAITIAIIVLYFNFIDNLFTGRIENLITVMLVGSVVTILTLASSSKAKSFFIKKLKIKN